jgi:hypothetical protein
MNIGINISSLFGLIYFLTGIAYFIFLIVFLSANSRRMADWLLPVFIMQIFFIPLLLIISGGILFFQGWRLDPVLQFGQFLSFIVIILLLIKDILVSTNSAR